MKKTYPQFAQGIQENTQDYAGGIWSGSDLDLGTLPGVVRPSTGREDLDFTLYNPNVVVDTFAADGTWTCPAGVTSAVVECWGAGGGGVTNTGGGGGGAYSKKTVTVVPTTGYAVVVGTSSAGGAGGDTTFATTTVVAKGGASGTTGTGGAASGGTGDTKYSGGNGSTGTNNRGGGGSAGDTSDGGNGSAAGGGSAGTTHGAGGGTIGGEGSIPGGGGGSLNASQFTGARGEVRVTYTVNQSTGYATVRGRSWGRSTSGVTSFPVTMPTGIIAGELLVIIFGVDGNPTCSIADTSWTKLGQDSNSTSVTQAIFYKIATGSDTATITTSATESGTHIVYRIANAQVPTCTFANGSSTNADPPSHTSGSGTANRLWLTSAAWDSGIGSFNITAQPTGYQGWVDIPPGDSGSAITAVAEKTGTSATENPGTWTSTTEQWVAATIGLEWEDSLSAGSDLIIDMEGYTANNTYDIYALVRQGSTGYITARNAETEAFTAVNAITENPVGSLDTYNNWLMWCTTTTLGKYDGSTFTNSYQTWQTTQETGLFMPSVKFAGNMYWGNMRYVAKLDPTPTWDADALTLPLGFKIIDMRVWNDQIAILAQKSGSSVEVKVFFWDGTSATYEDVAQLNDAQPMGLATYLGALLVVGLGGRLYQYRGASADGVQDFEIVRKIPGNITLQNPSCILMSDGELLFGVGSASSDTLGVWAFGRPPGSTTATLYPKYTPKGDYKFDDGVTDYYAVTTLFNLRVDDTAFNPQQVGIPATVTADSAVGDSTWNKITSKALSYTVNASTQIATDDDGSVIALIGPSDQIQISTDSGTSWTERDSSRTWADIAVSDTGATMLAADGAGGASSYVYVSTDTGANWTAKNTANPKTWTRVSMDDDGSVMAAVSDSSAAAYISTDTGANWTSRTVGVNTANDVCMSTDGAIMYAAMAVSTSTANIRKSTNTGTSWADSGVSIASDPNSIACSSNGAVVLFGTGTVGAYYSTNSGSSWTQVPVATTGAIRWVSVSEDGTKMIISDQNASDENGVYYSDDSGANWSWLGTITDTSAVAVSGDGTVAYAPQEGSTGPLWVVAAPGTAAATDDNTYVMTGSRDTDTSSFYLKALNPGFSVATDKTITGIKVEISMKKATGTTAKDVTVKLVQGGSVVGDNKGANTDRSAAESIYTYGGPTDLWGTTWTPAQVNASTFGVVLQAKNTAAVLAVDNIVITVSWASDAQLPTQEEFLYAAVRRGNSESVTETMTSGIVDLRADGFSTANIFTVADDLGYPANNKLINSISLGLTKPLTGTELITVYANTDDSDFQAHRDITWTQVAQFDATNSTKTRFLRNLSCRRIRWRFVITPADGTPDTPPGLLSYTLGFEPIGTFIN